MVYRVGPCPLGIWPVVLAGKFDIKWTVDCSGQGATAYAGGANSIAGVCAAHYSDTAPGVLVGMSQWHDH